MRRYVAIIAGLCVALCAGCLPGSPPPAVATQTKLFEDVPIMTGFDYQEESSFLHVGKRRMCVLKYIGKADMLGVVKYYKDSMQASKWEHKTTIGNDTINMLFSKADETALIQVQKLKSGEVLLVIQINPSE